MDETILVQKAPPRFAGHQQPRIYCLGTPDITQWDDTDISIMDTQIGLAKDYGVSFFIFDNYLGSRNGRLERELGTPLDEAFLKTESSKGMKFGLMGILGGSSRVVIPVKPQYMEPGRNFAVNTETVQAIVDMCVQNYWQLPNYLNVKNRPYLSLYIAGHEPAEKIKQILEEVRQHAHTNYQVDPYVVGVTTEPRYLPLVLEEIGFDAITGYAWLPDFSQQAPLIQDYGELLERRMQEWEEAAQLKIPVVPSAVVGWDASPRFEAGYNIDISESIEKLGLNDYPLVPVVTNNTPAEFERMLRETRKFIEKHVPLSERYNIIFSWNEIAEGGALLPQITSDGIDFSYLEAVKRVVKSSTI